jgi:AcrR family transcriptional regulator
MRMNNKVAAKSIRSSGTPMDEEAGSLALRRNTGKGDATAAAILEQAKNILTDQGLAGISIRSLATRCRISPGNVTYYFKTKEILFAELAKYIFARWSRRFYRKMPDYVASPRDRFVYSIEYMIEENKRPKTSAMLLEMWAMSTHSPAVITMMDVFYAEMRSWIAELLRAMKPLQSERTRGLRAALITAQIEGLMILIGPNRTDHAELHGLEREAVAQITHLALSD